MMAYKLIKRPCRQHCCRATQNTFAPAALGCRTLGQLAPLPETGLISRLGPHGLRPKQLARSEAPHLLTPEEPAFLAFRVSGTGHARGGFRAAALALSRLLGDIARKAVDHAYAIRSLTTIPTLERAQTHTVCVAPATPAQKRENLLKLLNLELQAHPPQAEVVALRLVADAAQPQAAQRDST